MGTTYVNLTDSDILNETATYEDIGINSAEVVKEYNRLIDEAMNNNTIGNWQAVSEYRTNNADILDKVIISSDTINNIIKTILTLEQYAIQKRNQLLIQSDEPTTQATGDYWVKIDENNNVLDIMHYDGSTYKSVINCTLATTSVGSNTKPVYFDNGQPVECDYEIDYALSDFGITVSAEEINRCEGLTVDINTSLTNLGGQIDAVEVATNTKISNVEKSLEKSINTVNNKLSDDISGVDTRVSSLASNVSALSTKVATNTKNINTNAANITSIKSNYLPKTGGTLSGATTVGGNFTVNTTATWVDFKPSSAIRCYSILRAYDNNKISLGTSGVRWKEIWCNNSLNTASDRNLKKDIVNITDDYDEFYDSLIPVSYKFIDGTSNRTHTGFISQDVEEALINNNLTALDFAGFCKDTKKKEVVVEEAEYDNDGNIIKEAVINEVDALDEYGNVQYDYALRYSEFIALNTNQIQKLKTRVSNLETENAEIKAENTELKATLENVLERLAALENK